MNSSAWLQIPSAVSDFGLGAKCEQSIRDKVEQGEISLHDIQRLEKMKLELCDGALDLSTDQLEKLRRLCQLWDVNLDQVQITSHRRFLGPIIVAAKKALLPVVRFFLRDFMRQQRDFNATSIALLAGLSRRR